MPDIVATVADPEANSYLEFEDANDKMDSYLHAEEWASIDESQRMRILITGTRLIDQYQAWGPKSDLTQALSFPTRKDFDADGNPAIPAEVKRALLEYCDYMAAGDLDHLKKLQAEGVTNSSMLGQNATFGADKSQLPAATRKELDKVWLRHNSPTVVLQSPYETPDCGSIFG